MGSNHQNAFAYISDGFNTHARIGEGRKIASPGAFIDRENARAVERADAVFLSTRENHEYERLDGSGFVKKFESVWKLRGLAGSDCV